MITKDWSVAFTITFKGLQIDFMELPDDARLQILKSLILQSLIAGETEGILYGETSCEQVAL